MCFLIGKDYIPKSFFYKVGICEPPGSCPTTISNQVKDSPVKCVVQPELPSPSSGHHTAAPLLDKPPEGVYVPPGAHETVSDVVHSTQLPVGTLSLAKAQLLDALPGIKADTLEQVYRPRIMCLIFTTPGAWQVKARAVNDTWAKR